MASYLMPRPFPYNAARFRFAFRLHLAAITVLALIAFLILQFSSRLLMVAYILIFAMVIVVALTLLNAMWPVRTTHSVDGESVVLRQGLSFKLSIPLSKVSKAKRTDVGTGRSGIHLDRGNGVLEVIAAGPEAVRLRLNDPVVHKGVLVREVLVDVLEPREFIECIRERKKGAILMERLPGGKGTKVPAGDREAPGPEDEADEGAGEGPEPDVAEDEAPEEPEAKRPEPLPSPPPVRVPKAAARPAPPPPRPDEPKAPERVPKAHPKSDDEDEIELVPALPSQNGAPARVVRIPKRKL